MNQQHSVVGVLARALMVACLAALAACTARQGYEGVRAGERNRCWSLPETERERCLRRTEDDYDTYRRKRDDVKQQDAPLRSE
ncbi:MAG: hypothetical protein AB7N70_22710 [Dehalococcoidia bacterium]